MGDCRQMLAQVPDNAVDVIVSSPPYNIGKAYETRVALELYLAEQREVLRECHRVLKPTGSIFWQTGMFTHQGTVVPLDVKFFPMLEELGMQPRNRIVWIRQHGLHAKTKFSGRHETILWFSKSDDYRFDLDAVRVPQKWPGKRAHRGPNKGELTCHPNGKNPGDVWAFQNVKHNHEEQTVHPAQFPEGLVARIALATVAPGGVMLDPYMGAGTVAVVARDHGLNFLGAEADPVYHQVAEHRLSGEPDAHDMFPNLKTLRAYVSRTGLPIERFRFSTQIGLKASTRTMGNSEQQQIEQYGERLASEEDAFEQRARQRA